jgi:hypothetical protein
MAPAAALTSVKRSSRIALTGDSSPSRGSAPKPLPGHMLTFRLGDGTPRRQGVPQPGLYPGVRSGPVVADPVERQGAVGGSGHLGDQGRAEGGVEPAHHLMNAGRWLPPPPKGC